MGAGGSPNAKFPGEPPTRRRDLDVPYAGTVVYGV